MMTTGSISSSSPSGSGLPSPAHESPEDNLNKLTSFLHHLAGCIDVELDNVLKDHCYARPWNWRPENVYVKPIKKIFFSDRDVSRDRTNEDDEIDVETCETVKELTLPYDLTKLRQCMEESQKLANFARPDDNIDNWEEKVEKSCSSPLQGRLFTRVFQVISTERLTRLVKVNCATESVYRRISTDSSTQKFREILASIGWDWRIIQWLHGLLLDNLPCEFLVIYLDILQTLRAKVPQLVEKMIAVQPNAIVKTGAIPNESLGAVLKRSWDPVANCLNSNRPKKLPGNPVIIIAPSGVGSTISSRQHKWITQLGLLGMVVTIHSHLGLSTNRMTMMACVEQLVQTTRVKIQDVRSDFPGRPIILIGFNTGAALACQVALLEHVTAVVCLGFPFATAEGNRGALDDTLLDMRCPILFIVGQNAKLTKIDDIEDIREKLLVESSLVVVGTADDHLRISTLKKISEGITQSMVDRCILDEIADFVASILLQPLPLPLRPIGFYNIQKATKREQRKRKNSTGSTVDSESNFPNSQKHLRSATPVDNATLIPNQTIQNASKSTSTISLSQPVVSKVRGSNSINHTGVQRRRSKTVNIQKASVPEQSAFSKQLVQTNSASNGGLTLSIGSLASLGTSGPIKLGPNSGSQSSNIQIKAHSISKQPVSMASISKMVQTSNSSNATGKMKTVAPTKMINKTGSISSRSTSVNTRNNYKAVNFQEKSSDTKLVTVLSTSGNHVKVSTPSLSVIQNKPANSATHLAALLHNQKSTNESSNEGSFITSSISGLNSNDSSNPNTTSIITSTTTTKAMKNPRQALNADSINMISVTRIAENMPNSGQLSTFTINENTDNPITVLPWSNKVADNSQKNLHESVKIAVNLKNQWTKSHLPFPVVNNDSPSIDLTDELGNILDIPIIFAKDDDNFNIVDKPSPSIKLTNTNGLCQQLNNTKKVTPTKVVLLSQKEGKMYRPSTKIHTKISEQTQTALNKYTENGNLILRAQTQTSSTSNRDNLSFNNISRTKNSTIKYTKIILSKRNSGIFNSVNDQVILKKTSTARRVSSQINIDNKKQHQLSTPVNIIQKWGNCSIEDIANVPEVINNRKSIESLNNLPEVECKAIEKE